MKRRWRLAALVALCALVAPGTWLRTAISEEMPTDIRVEAIAGPSATDNPEWRVEGVWAYHGEGRYFGGFSAILALEDGTLSAFSDRGARFVLTDPASPSDDLVVTLQQVAPELMEDLWDIESATRDPKSGTYWLGYEHRHAIHRFTASHEAEEMVDLDPTLDWYTNGGLEAMERLSDGRFFALGEGKDYALIWPDDPVDGAKAERLPFTNPAPGFVVSDMVQLPDGRVLVLMRRVVRSVPPFEALLAIGEPPEAASTQAWAPQVAIRLDGVIPADNYEGMAVQAREDGSVTVWLIADDNFSILQRNLLAKLVFDPS